MSPSPRPTVARLRTLEAERDYERRLVVAANQTAEALEKTIEQLRAEIAQTTATLEAATADSEAQAIAAVARGLFNATARVQWNATGDDLAAIIARVLRAAADRWALTITVEAGPRPTLIGPDGATYRRVD